MKLKTLWILSVIQAILSGIVLAYTLIAIYQAFTLYSNLDAGNYNSIFSTGYSLLSTASFLINTAPTIAWLVLILEGIIGGILFNRAFIVGDRRISKVCIINLVGAILWIVAIIISGRATSIGDSINFMMIAYIVCSGIGIAATILFTKLRKIPDLAMEFASSTHYPRQYNNNQNGQYQGQDVSYPNQQMPSDHPTVDTNGEPISTDTNEQQASAQSTPNTTSHNNWNTPSSQVAQGQQGPELRPLNTEELKAKSKETVDKLKDNATTLVAKGKEVSKDLIAKGKEFVKTKEGKRVAIGGGIVVIAIIVLVIVLNVISMLKTYPVTLISSCNVTFTGYNGEGQIASYTCESDYDITNSNLEAFAQTISYEFFLGDEPIEGTLSNGDIVTVKANYSSETAKSLKISTSSETLEVTVTGLTEVSKTWGEVSETDKVTIRSLAETRFETYIDNYISRNTSTSTWSSLPSSMELVESRVVGEYYLYNSSTHKGQLASIYYFVVYRDYDDNDSSEDGYTGHYCIIYVNNILPDYDYTSSDTSSSSSTYTIDWDSEVEEDVVDYLVRTYLTDHVEVSLSIDNSAPEYILVEPEDTDEETEG